MKKAQIKLLIFFVILLILLINVSLFSLIPNNSKSKISGLPIYENSVNEEGYNSPRLGPEDEEIEEEEYPIELGPEDDGSYTSHESDKDYERNDENDEEKNTCEVGYLEEYRCNGVWKQRKWQYLSCNTEWKNYEYCYYGCSNNGCNSEPEEEEENEEDEIEETCNSGYLEEYQCFDDTLKRKYQYSDCDYYWFFYEYCDYGCSNNECNSEPEEEEETEGDEEEENDEEEEEPEESGSLVIKVVDGDTIKLSDGETVRLLGINTDEKGQKCFEEAKERLEQLVLNKRVILEQDGDNRGVYGRLLRYIFVERNNNNLNVNVLMVREGLANVYVVGSNNKYESELEEAEREAKEEEGCIWQKSYSCKDCIGVSFFKWNAEGDDCENPNDEYVKFSNNCEQECDMGDWTVKDEATHIYTFPDFILQGNSQITLRSGNGEDTVQNLFWKNHGNAGSCPAIWNNGGDILWLRDDRGNLVLEWGY